MQKPRDLPLNIYDVIEEKSLAQTLALAAAMDQITIMAAGQVAQPNPNTQTIPAKGEVIMDMEMTKDERDLVLLADPEDVYSDESQPPTQRSVYSYVGFMDLCEACLGKLPEVLCKL